jgi:hypothetical protein
MAQPIQYNNQIQPGQIKPVDLDSGVISSMIGTSGSILQAAMQNENSSFQGLSGALLAGMNHGLAAKRLDQEAQQAAANQRAQQAQEQARAMGTAYLAIQNKKAAGTKLKSEEEIFLADNSAAASAVSQNSTMFTANSNAIQSRGKEEVYNSFFNSETTQQQIKATLDSASISSVLDNKTNTLTPRGNIDVFNLNHTALKDGYMQHLIKQGLPEGDIPALLENGMARMLGGKGGGGGTSNSTFLSLQAEQVKLNKDKTDAALALQTLTQNADKPNIAKAAVAAEQIKEDRDFAFKVQQENNKLQTESNRNLLKKYGIDSRNAGSSDNFAKNSKDQLSLTQASIDAGYGRNVRNEVFNKGAVLSSPIQEKFRKFPSNDKQLNTYLGKDVQANVAETPETAMTYTMFDKALQKSGGDFYAANADVMLQLKGKATSHQVAVLSKLLAAANTTWGQQESVINSYTRQALTPAIRSEKQYVPVSDED